MSSKKSIVTDMWDRRLDRYVAPMDLQHSDAGRSDESDTPMKMLLCDALSGRGAVWLYRGCFAIGTILIRRWWTSSTNVRKPPMIDDSLLPVWNGPTRADTRRGADTDLFRTSHRIMTEKPSPWGLPGFGRWLDGIACRPARGLAARLRIQAGRAAQWRPSVGNSDRNRSEQVKFQLLFQMDERVRSKQKAPRQDAPDTCQDQLGLRPSLPFDVVTRTRDDDFAKACAQIQRPGRHQISTRPRVATIASAACREELVAVVPAA